MQGDLRHAPILFVSFWKMPSEGGLTMVLGHKIGF